MRIEEGMSIDAAEYGRSLGADRGGKVTWGGQRREGHLGRIEEGRPLGADRRGKVTWGG